jgi:myo-inositol-1(or 4)-monophosphatase
MQRSPESLTRIALDVATEAAALLLQGWRTHPSASEKRPTELVTEFDLASERLIRERLAQHTPEMAVVGEELGGTAHGPQSWFCDPLDGTTNFVHGHHFFCVSIGVLERGVPIAGAVVAPALNTSWVGWRGGSAQRNEQACHVSDTERLHDALVATGFPSDRSSAPGNNFDTFIRVKQSTRGVRRCGSAALDLCLVADGTYDAYWERQLHAWDAAAGAAIVLAGGGTLTALDGGVADFSTGHILASNGKLHAALRALMD